MKYVQLIAAGFGILSMPLAGILWAGSPLHQVVMQQASASQAAVAPVPPTTAPSKTTGKVLDRSSLLSAINRASEPSIAIEAYAKAIAEFPTDMAIKEAFMQRMIGFGLPGIAASQAREIVGHDKTDGLAWAVLADDSGRRGDADVAVSEILNAVKYKPDDQFVQSTAGQLVAWYDADSSRVGNSSALKESVRTLWEKLATKSVFMNAYKQAKQFYSETSAEQSEPAGRTSSDGKAPPPSQWYTSSQPADIEQNHAASEYNYNVYSTGGYTSPGGYYGSYGYYPNYYGYYYPIGGFYTYYEYPYSYYSVPLYYGLAFCHYHHYYWGDRHHGYRNHLWADRNPIHGDRDGHWFTDGRGGLRSHDGVNHGLAISRPRQWYESSRNSNPWISRSRGEGNRGFSGDWETHRGTGTTVYRDTLPSSRSFNRGVFGNESNRGTVSRSWSPEFNQSRSTSIGRSSSSIFRSPSSFSRGPSTWSGRSISRDFSLSHGTSFSRGSSFSSGHSISRGSFSHGGGTFHGGGRGGRGR